MIRIIGGNNKGRRIKAPNNLPVRPTTDFAKEALFNILNNYFDFEEVKVLDLYCGTGNISYEFASRGTLSITSVDSNYHCTEFVKKTAHEMPFEQIQVYKADVLNFLKKHSSKYDIIFADPPFDYTDTDKISPLVFEKDLLKENGLLIIEHGERADYSTQPYFKEKRKYGKINFSMFTK